MFSLSTALGKAHLVAQEYDMNLLISVLAGLLDNEVDRVIGACSERVMVDDFYYCSDCYLRGRMDVDRSI